MKSNTKREAGLALGSQSHSDPSEMKRMLVDDDDVHTSLVVFSSSSEKALVSTVERAHVDNKSTNMSSMTVRAVVFVQIAASGGC